MTAASGEELEVEQATAPLSSVPEWIVCSSWPSLLNFLSLMKYCQVENAASFGIFERLIHAVDVWKVEGYNSSLVGVPDCDFYPILVSQGTGPCVLEAIRCQDSLPSLDENCGLLKSALGSELLQQ